MTNKIQCRLISEATFPERRIVYNVENGSKPEPSSTDPVDEGLKIEGNTKTARDKLEGIKREIGETITRQDAIDGLKAGDPRLTPLYIQAGLNYLIRSNYIEGPELTIDSYIGEITMKAVQAFIAKCNIENPDEPLDEKSEAANPEVIKRLINALEAQIASVTPVKAEPPAPTADADRQEPIVTDNLDGGGSDSLFQKRQEKVEESVTLPGDIPAAEQNPEKPEAQTRFEDAVKDSYIIDGVRRLDDASIMRMLYAGEEVQTIAGHDGKSAHEKFIFRYEGKGYEKIGDVPREAWGTDKLEFYLVQIIKDQKGKPELRKTSRFYPTSSIPLDESAGWQNISDEPQSPYADILENTQEKPEAQVRFEKDIKAHIRGMKNPNITDGTVMDWLQKGGELHTLTGDLGTIHEKLSFHFNGRDYEKMGDVPREAWGSEELKIVMESIAKTPEGEPREKLTSEYNPNGTLRWDDKGREWEKLSK